MDGDMTAAATNNPSSSLGLSSDQLNSLALAPSSTELLYFSNAMQSNFESAGKSGFGSLPLVPSPDGNSLTVSEAFGMMSSNSHVRALVMEIITNVGTVAGMWKVLMSNDAILNFLKTGFITISQQLGASESASMGAKKGKGIWAIIWKMLEMFSLWDMIKGFTDELFLGKGGSGSEGGSGKGGSGSEGGSIDSIEESRRRQLQISLAVSILIFLGVLVVRVTLMV